jgi:CRP/FNR family transcriptional regulator, cyclic AMP receptor protein
VEVANGFQLRSIMRSPYGLEIVENCQRCELRAGQVFCDLPSPTLDALQSIGFTTACPKGSAIVAQGQPAREVAVLCAGHVKISTASRTGRKICLGIAGPGTVLGLSAAISGKPHQVVIEALEPCQLRVIKADLFLALLRKDRAACFAAVKFLSNEVRKMHACARLFGLSHSAAERLARVLVQWEMREDDKPKSELRLRFSLTHRELAEILGVRRETVTRLLSTFEQKELIRCRGTTLVIEDEHKLRALAVAA